MEETSDTDVEYAESVASLRHQFLAGLSVAIVCFVVITTEYLPVGG